VVKDADGREWHVVQTSVKQVVLRTQAPVFSLTAEPPVVRTAPGTRATVRFKLGRTAVVPAPVEVRLYMAEGMRGVSMEPLILAVGQSEGEAVLRIAADADLGADNHLWFEATTRRSDSGHTVFFRAPVELELSGQTK
jgi:hypothetical protein